MRNRNRIEILFAQAADLMGWGRSDAYDAVTRNSHVGATFIQRAATEAATVFWEHLPCQKILTLTLFLGLASSELTRYRWGRLTE